MENSAGHAHDLGYKACQAGVKRTKNPYRTGLLRTRWAEGYALCAQHEAEAARKAAGMN